MSVMSFAALSRGQDEGGLGLTGIQIPMIQRDYAQGRALVAAGATSLVAGSAIFGANDPAAAVRALRGA